MPTDDLYQSHLKANLADMLADAEALVSARLTALTNKALHDRAEDSADQIIALKSINEITRAYTDRLTNMLYETFRTGDAVDLRRSHKALLRDLAPRVYVEGMREGGINEPDEEDRQVTDEASADWVAGQVEFVNAFAKDAAAAKKDKDARPAILARVEGWVSSLRNFGEAGKLYALGNIALTFDGDDGQESCEDCQRYKGQRHKRNWWAERGLLERNGNENYACGRWDPCQHSFRDDKGGVVVS